PYAPCIPARRRHHGRGRDRGPADRTRRLLPQGVRTGTGRQQPGRVHLQRGAGVGWHRHRVQPVLRAQPVPGGPAVDRHAARRGRDDLRRDRFYCWSVVFPRSGGVYVFLSRTINPGVAFVMPVVETVILLYYAALAAGLIVQVGLSSFFGAVGMVSRNSTLISWGATVAKPAGVFWIGTLIIVVAGLLLVSGTRRYFTVQRVLFVIAVAGLAVIAVVMIFGS